MQNDIAEIKDTLARFQTNQGVEVQATLLRLTRFVAVFEVYSQQVVLRTSEVLSEFHVLFQERAVYAGRAVVSSLVNTGTVAVCEVKLDETGFLVASLPPAKSTSLREGFGQFLKEWQKLYKVLPEFKVVVADMQTFLTDVRFWLEQVELEIRAAPAGNRLGMEQEALNELGDAIVPAFDALHERLEHLSESIEGELRPVHQNFAKRMLHPIVMCSPFAYRTYHKPLGYAGDYEMVNMILRDPFEGGSLFAKATNLWFLRQWPARAHRNRISYLVNTLKQEALRSIRQGRRLRVFNLGCGPAVEVQRFLAEDRHSEDSQFTLLDFNEETILHATRQLEEAKRTHNRGTPIQIQRKSVQHVLKEASKPSVDTPDKKLDLVYCAGLFDYLSDRTCKQLMNVFYEWLAPGGILVVTNVDNCKPFRHMLEFVLDWHLIYRGNSQALALAPDRAPAQGVSVKRDETGVNLFIEVRKPEHV